MITSIIIEQDRKYNEMIEAERLKTEIAAIEAKDAEDRAIREDAEKAAAEEKKQELIKELTEEPTEGEIISIAFRLPNGTRLLRNFKQCDKVKVVGR